MKREVSTKQWEEAKLLRLRVGREVVKILFHENKAGLFCFRSAKHEGVWWKEPMESKKSKMIEKEKQQGP